MVFMHKKMLLLAKFGTINLWTKKYERVFIIMSIFYDKMYIVFKAKYLII